jgi:hypothetical protein
MPGAFDPLPAAQALAEAWREGASIGALPAPPRTLAQAERVGFAMLAELDLAAVGFRAVALESGAIVTGPVVETRLLPGGVALPAGTAGVTMRAGLFAPLAEALPGGRAEITWPKLLALLGPMRAALDVAAARVTTSEADAVLATADLAWLGHIVLAPAGRHAKADAAALAVTLGTTRARLDARPMLLATANAARRAGGLPPGAALCVALPLAAPIAERTIACRITGLGTAAARLL